MPLLRISSFGDAGLIADFDSLAEVLHCFAGLKSTPAPDGVLDVVPAARTIVVTFSGQAAGAQAREAQAREAQTRKAQLEAWIREAAPAEPSSYATSGGEAARIPVSYTGPDLSSTADFLGLSRAELVGWHTGTVFTAAFTGFAPGFAYLVPEDGAAALPRPVPRRDSPRTSVPAGSVGLAGEFSAVYPVNSPGGWQLIGSTTAVLWDAHRENPALLQPGTRVRFTADGGTP